MTTESSMARSTGGSADTGISLLPFLYEDSALKMYVQDCSNGS